MSWTPLAPPHVAPRTRPEAAVTLSVSAGAGRLPARMTLVFRASLLPAPWLRPGRAVQVLAGTGENAGRLRIAPDGAFPVGKVALARPEGSLVQVKLALLPGVAAAKRGPVALDWLALGDGIVLTLPAWAAGPAATPREAAPAPAAPRAVPPAATGPAPRAATGNATPPARGAQLAAQAAEMARARAAGRVP